MADSEAVKKDAVSPERQKFIDRISKIEGQVKGIKKMMLEERDCFDVLRQIGAASGALRSLQRTLLEQRVHRCLGEALESGDRREELVRELVRHLGDFKY